MHRLLWLLFLLCIHLYRLRCSSNFIGDCRVKAEPLPGRSSARVHR